jgi:hypothetical protein
MVTQKLLVIVICVGLVGCSVNRAGYTAIGTAAGAGIGYSYHKQVKEAVIGGVAGGAAGTILVSLQENSVRNKFTQGYQQGYNQANVDIAIHDWNENTGKCANYRKSENKRLACFKVPQREQDNVVYESHYVTLEDYR